MQKEKERRGGEKVANFLKKKASEFISRIFFLLLLLLCSFFPKKNMYETCEQLYSDESNFPDDLLELSEFFSVAYDLTNTALVKGWEFTTTRKNTLRLLREFRKKLDNISSHRYDTLRDYNLSGRGVRWNIIALIFMLKCNILIMESTLSRYKSLTIEEKKKLVCEGLLTRAKEIKSYTQIELYEAIMCLNVNWHNLNDSKEIWQYIEKLQVRAAQLIIIPGEKSVFDGPSTWRKSITETQYTSSHEYVSDLSTLFTLFLRSKAVHKLFSVELGISKEITGKAGGYDLDVISTSFRKWVETEINGYQESSFKSQLKKTINTLCGYLGEPERYARDHQGIMAKDVFAIIEHSRPPLQVAWWTSNLGKGNPKELLNHDVLGSYPPSVVTLKIFHSFCESRVNGFKWWNNSVVMEHDVYRTLAAVGKQKEHGKMALVARKEPLIVQHMGEFNVFYNKKFFRTRTVEIAISLWVIISVTARDAKFKLLNNIYDLSRLSELLAEWNNESEQMEIDQIEQKEAMIEIDA